MNEVIFASACEITRLIRKKEISCVEVVESHISRIEDVNLALNAVVCKTFDTAKNQAKLYDDQLSKEFRDFAPLYGVPMTLKDSLDTKGVCTTGGTRGRSNFIPQEDASLVKRLKNAGAVLLGKTNTPELTLSPETNNLIFGRTNNPFDVTRTPGGSSGGAGAIVSSGGAAFDIGSDTGGSIRFPSHYCGIFGLKPTSGRVPRTGHLISFDVGASEAFTQNGPMARHVVDLEMIYKLISGPDGIDPYIVPMPIRDSNNVDISSLKVVYYIDNGVFTPTNEIKMAVKKVIQALEDVVKSVDEDCPHVIQEFPTIANDLAGADGRTGTARILEKSGTSQMDQWLQRRFDQANPISVSEFTNLLEKIDRYRSEMTKFFGPYDVIISPIAPFPAMEHELSLEQPYVTGLFSYNQPYNIAGWPLVAVPVGVSSEGLPIGVQVISKPWREDVALAVATFLEQNFGGWIRPPI